LLPGVEKGEVTLIGATTENPSFSVIAALLSRCKVLVLEPLSVDDIVKILKNALTDCKKGLGNHNVAAEDDALQFIAKTAHGDARYALGTLNLSVQHAIKGSKTGTIDINCVEEAASTRALLYDKSGEEHYNVVSAFIKSMRGSDPDAALYWMFRMLDAGEDPLFVLRRMIIFASEDVGNADPHALMVAVAADSAFARTGMPEGVYALAQVCTYLACAPKSNAQVNAVYGPKGDIKKYGALPVPKKLRNAPTAWMKESGYGKNYRYPPSEGGFAAGEIYLPDELKNKRYYIPTNNGIEERIAKRLNWQREQNKK
jgi:putative ATPase